jgi:Na+/H+-dicarboxylate symporter
MGYQKLMGIVWPAFLAACLLELLVFALVDPQDIHWAGQPVGLSRMGVYTAAFFAFWSISAVASGLTSLLARSPAEVNGCPVAPESRPRGCQ